MAANTTGTDVVASSFDREQRQLILYGPASPETFEAVLQTITYISLAPDINVARIEVDIHDGINNTLESIAVIQGTMRKKRDVAMATKEPESQHFHNRHVLSVGDESEEVSSSFLGIYWPFAVITLSFIGILIAILVGWGVRPKKLPISLA